MQTVINSTTNTFDPQAIGVEEGAAPHTIVLQPSGCLDSATSSRLQQDLRQALEATTNAVIVDLLHIGAVEPEGISALLAGIKLAASLNKSLSICSMSRMTRLALETEWNRQRSATLGSWSDLCKQDFELFLQTSSWARKQALEAQATAKTAAHMPLPRRISSATSNTNLERTHQTA